MPTITDMQCLSGIRLPIHMQDDAVKANACRARIQHATRPGVKVRPLNERDDLGSVLRPGVARLLGKRLIIAGKDGGVLDDMAFA